MSFRRAGALLVLAVLGVLSGLAAPAGAVVSPPTVGATFTPSGIQPNATSTLTITITNPNATGLTGVAFTDTLPTNVVVGTPATVGNTCGGTATATAGSSSVGLSGGTVAGGSASCTVTVNVTSSFTGSYTDTTGPVTSNGAPPGTAATATLIVANPPTINKSFSAPNVVVNGTVAVYFLITNPNSGDGGQASPVTLTNVSFSDPLPVGMIVASPNQASTDCGGTLTAIPGSGSITFTGGTIAPPGPDGVGNTCNIAVEVEGTTTGTKNNTTSNVSANESGAGGNGFASVDVLAAPVIQPPTISKQFSPTSVTVNGTSQLSFTIQNPNSDPNGTTLHNVSFTDTLPAGMVVATPSQAYNDCGGTITATPGSGSVSFSGGTIGPPQPPDNTGGLCDVTVEVKATAIGTLSNTVGPVSSTEATGTVGSSADLTVTSAPAVAPPTLAAAFGATAIAVGQSTSLTFTVTNPNTTALSNVGFTDPLPTGLQVASPNGLSNTCGSQGAISAVPGSSSITLSGVPLVANASCHFKVNVVGTAAGAQANTIDTVSGNYDNPGGDPGTASGPGATAGLLVIAPPTISEAFTPASITVGASSRLAFTISNPNQTAGLTGIAFSDTLPAGVVIATPSGASSTCAGGTLTAAPGGTTVALSNGSLAAASGCAVSVLVTSTTTGVIHNTSGAVSSNEGGVGTTASASLTVLAPGLPTVTIATPSGGAKYAFKQVVDASYSCADDPNGPGLQSCTGTVANGAPIDTSKAGSQSFTVTATSKDGQTATTTVTYTVAGPSNRVTIRRPRVLKGGTVTLDLGVPGGGTVDALESAPKAGPLCTRQRADVALAAVTLKPGRGRFTFARLHISAARPRTLHLKLRPNKGAAAYLRTHRNVRVTLSIAFTPLGGSPRTVGLRLLIKGCL